MEKLPSPAVTTVPYWVRDHIRGQGVRDSVKESMTETVAEWLDSGLLFVEPPESATQELQDEPALVSANGGRLRLGDGITSRPELDQQILLYAKRLDLVFYGRSLSAVDLKARMYIQENIQVRAKRILHEIQFPDAEVEFLTPTEKIEEQLVERCVGCMGLRGVAEAGSKLSLVGLAGCAELPDKKMKNVVSRMSKRPRALFERDLGSTRESYSLTEEACKQKLKKLPNDCHELVPKPPNKPKVFRDKQPQEPPSERLEVEPSDVTSEHLEAAIKLGLVQPLRRRRRPDDVRYKGRYISLSPDLFREITSVQRATLHVRGLDELFYGERLDPVVLQDELGLLPRDSLLALVGLIEIKIGRSSENSTKP